jgi:hypothetical protein
MLTKILAKLIDFLSKWNPFNIYGTEVEIDDLIQRPLELNETLMQDCRGQFHRIQAPAASSSWKNHLLFWLQTHLNSKGHLDAIDSVICQYQTHLIKNPPFHIQSLNLIQEQTDHLLALKNDYYFSHLNQGNSAFVDSKLLDIQKQAYSIFASNHRQQAIVQEEIRRKAFFEFCDEIKKEVEELHVSHLKSLSTHNLSEAAIQLIDQRVNHIECLYHKIELLEKQHQGKFTIPSLRHYIKIFYLQLKLELNKLEKEIHLLDQKSVVLSQELYDKVNQLKHLL